MLRERAWAKLMTGAPARFLASVVGMTVRASGYTTLLEACVLSKAAGTSHYPGCCQYGRTYNEE